MLKSAPFLLFDGNCAEAMTFYHQCLGGELMLTKLGETPMKDLFPPEKHDRIINAQLKNGNIDISATDWMASPEFDPLLGNTFAIFITGKTYDELKPVLTNSGTATITKDYKNCTTCRLEHTGSSTTNTAFSGFLEAKKPGLNKI